MNRLFNKGRKYKVLSVLMALAMLFSLLPTNTVLANTTVSGGDADPVIEVVNDEPTIVSEEPVVLSETAVTASVGSTGGTIENITANYADLGWFAAFKYSGTDTYASFNLDTSNWDFNVYNKVTFDFTPSRADMKLRIRFQNYSTDEQKYAFAPYSSGHNTVQGGSGRQQVTCDLTGKSLEGMSGLQFYLDGGVTVSDQTFILNSITFSGDDGVTPVVFGNTQIIDDGTGDGKEPEGGDTPPAGDVNPDEGGEAVQPTLTKGWIDPCYTDVTDAHNGALVAVSYTTAVAWNQVFVGVAGHDVTAHDTVLIDITPSRAGMNLCIQDQSGIVYKWATLDDRKTLEIPLTQNVDTFKFLFDSNSGGYEAGEEITAIVHSIEFVNSEDLKPEPTGPVDVAAVLGIESGNPNFVIDEQGRAYSADGGKLRGMLEFPEDFRVEVGKVLTINYDTNITFNDKVIFAYGNGSQDFSNPSLVNYFKAGETSCVIEITQEIADIFAGNTNYAGASTRIRFKSSGLPAGSYLAINSVTYGAPEEDVKEPVIPSWQVNNGPKVTLNTENSVFACTVNEDKSVDVSFTAPAGWTALRADVENCDYTKYSRVKIDITPAAGLYLYVYGDANGDISGKKEFEDTKRTTIEFDLKADTTYFDIWCNPEAGKGTAGEKNFTIHSIKIVDPTMPEGEVIDAVLSVESDAFVMDGTDTVKAVDGGKLRARITLPQDFRVEEGKQIAFYYETNIDGLDVDFTWDWTDSSLANSTFKADKTSQAYIIDQGWIDYINNNATGTNPTVRLKLTSAPANSYFKLKYVIYGDVPENQYNPDQVPQGLVVTYYNDIYSRGVAWNTDNTVTENALYVVKATDGMTAETVVWTKEGTDGAQVPADGVQEITATYKATTDEVNKVWHTFKAHVENLTPGATYFYRAGNEATGWSEVGSFKVEKASTEIEDFSFIHVTDSQEEDEAGFMQWARVLKEAYATSPDAAFVAHTGDLVNNSAESSSAVHMMEWIYCFDVPMTQIMNGVLAPSCGNHDCFKYAFTDRFDIEWADHKSATEDKNDHLYYGGCYTVTYGEPGEDNNGLVLITLANTQEAWNYDSDFKLYQMEWLKDQLEQYNDYKWKVVQMHEGIMTAGDHTTDGEVDQMRDGLPPIFAEYEVDLVLQGHDHVYTRTRSYAYGENIFEEDGSSFDGHTPIWTKTLKLEPGESTKDGKVTNTLDRTLYLEPNGTHYITINSCGTKQYPEEPAENIDEVIFEGDNPLNPTDENGNWGSMCQTGFPMYGIVTIKDDFLIYDSYIYDNDNRKGELYDTFAVSKKYIAGYDTENPNDGKTEVSLYGIKMETKTFDGIAPKLDITGFNASNPEIMDYTTFKYTITGTIDGGGSYSQSGKGELFYGSNGKGIIPTEKGLYTLTVEIPMNHRYYYGSLSTTFAIN